MNWIVEEDGVTHINVYSKALTALGRWLTNFSLSPFHHPVHGYFASVEAAWYYGSTGFQHESLRTLHGFQAKQEGRKYEKVDIDPTAFAQFIKTCIRAKLIAHPEMLTLLIDSELPLVHYYVYGGKVVPAGYDWIMLYLEDIRSACKQKNYRP